MQNPIETQQLPPGRLTPNPWNTNVVGPEMEMRLRASIEKYGFYKPIIVRTLSDGSLQILGGEHRWRIASAMGMATVPVVNLGMLPERDAKIIGLSDNGQYGQDDAGALSDLLKEIGRDDIAELLPYTEEDLAGMFAREASPIDLDSLGFDDGEHEDTKSLDELVRPAITHELMRFKVPVEDRERVQRLVDSVIAQQGFGAEEDSMVAAGMALVVIANAAKDHL